MDKSVLQTKWHSLLASESLDILKTSKKGLTEDEVLSRRELFGQNKLPDA